MSEARGGLLSQLARKLKRLTVEAVPFDPSTFDDPVASSTEWGPAKGGGASFGTHKLVPVDSFRLEFRPALGAMVFYGIFFVAGVGLLIGSFFAFAGDGELPAFAILFVVGLVFSLVGGGLGYNGTAPIVFDKRRSAFWRGRTAPHEMANRASHPKHAPLDEIHALQLISELCSSDDGSYYSYELNVVLKDGRRINVVDHGKLGLLQGDAATVSEFLDVPVWDAT